MAYGDNKFLSGSAASRRKNVDFSHLSNKLSRAERKRLELSREAQNIKDKNKKPTFLIPRSYYPKSTDGRTYSLEEYKKTYEKIKDLDKLFSEIINSKTSKETILNLVRNRILERQTDADNSLIKRNYPTSGGAEQINWYKGKDTGRYYEERYNLYDSGEFFRTLSVEFKNNEIKIVSNSWKRQAIINAYGENAYQLTTQDVNDINKGIDNAIQEFFDYIKYVPSAIIF